MRALGWFAVASLLTVGILLSGGYIVAVAWSGDREQTVLDTAGIGGFGLACLLGAIILLLAIRRGGRVRTVRPPTAWVTLPAFFLLAGLGFLSVRWTATLALAPLLAVLALASFAAALARLGLRWYPDHRTSYTAAAAPGIWGMFMAPLLAILYQALVLGVLVGGVWLGVESASVEINNLDGLRDSLDAVATSNEANLPPIFETTTLAVGLVLLLAIAAPASEELTKFLGVLFLGRRGSVVTRPRVFVASFFAGLGFAIVETIGYALINPATWPQLVIARAPVALIHIACTTIVGIGWYLQRERGGLRLLWYYLAAVGLHGAWNGLFAGMLLLALNIGAAENPDPLAATGVLIMISGMGMVLLAAVVWVVKSARDAGREAYSGSPAQTETLTNSRAGDEVLAY